MPVEQIADRVAAMAKTDEATFQRRVRNEATALLAAVEGGDFDSPQPALGLEYELYAVDDTGALTAVPDGAFDHVGTDREVGQHQIEFHTTPSPFNADGLDAQAAQIRARIGAVAASLREEGVELVSDGLWTVPPADQTAREYLTDGETVDGTAVAANMCDKTRFHAQGNVYDATARIETPVASCEADHVMPNSLTTSIQPHFMLSEAATLPTVFRYALRIAGPVLALAANSPLFPPSLYDDVQPAAALAAADAEHRIGVFEGVMNAESGQPKVVFPDDVESVAEAIDRIVEEPPATPELFDREDATDRYPHFQHKHGSHWCWVRPVFEAPLGGSPNVRVEFRPLPSQPTITDSIALQALVSGLLVELPRTSHPASVLPWSDARANFYAAASDGLGADLRWIDATGSVTEEYDEIFADLLAAAESGLAHRGVDPDRVAELLEPLAARVRTRQTPASWKLDVARRRVEAGDDLDEAIRAAQRSYRRRQSESFTDGSFVDWLPATPPRPEPKT